MTTPAPDPRLVTLLSEKAFEHFDQDDNHMGKCVLLSDVLAEVEAHVQERIAAELDRLAADAHERGDIGKEGGIEAWAWLNAWSLVLRDRAAAHRPEGEA